MTEKTVARKRPSRKGARSAMARGRSRATAVTAASWYGARGAGYGVESRATPRARRRAPPRRARALRVRSDAVRTAPSTGHSPPDAPRRRRNHRPHAREQVLRRAGRIAAAEDEIERLGRSGGARRMQVVDRRKARPVGGDHERVHDEVRRRSPRRRSRMRARSRILSGSPDRRQEQGQGDGREKYHRPV